MKKLIYLLIIAAGVVSSGRVSAQGFTYTPLDPTYIHYPYIPDSIQVVKHRAIVSNNTSSTLNFRFARIENNIPASWQTQMCYDLCYAPMIDTISLPAFPPYSIGPNHTDTLFYIDFTCSGPGLGTSKVRMYNTDNPSLFIENTFQVEIGGSGITNISSEITNFSLSQNFPNPFNPVTQIIFSIPKTSGVSLKVYDALGHLVSNLIDNQNFFAGKYKVDFNGSNLSSGIYYYTISAGNFVESKKMILMK